MATAFHMHHHLQNALKIVLVGDSGVGKTWLLSRAQELYATFSDDGYSLFKKPFEPSKVYSPTVFESYFTNIDTQHLGNYQTNIWDTGGWWIFNSVRPLTYVGADVFMLCFDVTKPESFNNITKCWLPEVQKYQPGIPVLFVGTKSDLRAENESSGSIRFVSVSEAEAVAQLMGSLYQETSAQTGEHVDKAFDSAVKLAHTHRQGGNANLRRSKLFNKFDSAWLPPISSPPKFKADQSTHANDFREILKDVTSADVLFAFEDGSESIPAHRIVLWLRQSAFKDVFCDKDTHTLKKFKDIFEVKNMSADIFQQEENDYVYSKAFSQSVICVQLKSWISREIFIEILEFLYSGEVKISEVCECGKIKELLTAAEKLKVSSLVDICNYLLKLKGDEKTADTKKKSIGQPTPPPISVCDLFMDKKATPFSDVAFVVEGKLVFAHKAVLKARSPVLAALLGGNFREGKSSQIPLHGVDFQSFVAVLEYLYTDNCATLDKIPVENVLVVADRLCLPHLVQICEVQMHEGLQQIMHTQISENIAKEWLDVLDFSKMFNAKQLTEWCLYVIALNFTRFEGRGKELDLVVSENSQFFEKHTRPLQGYLRILESKDKWISLNQRQLHQKAKSCLPHKCTIL